METRSFHFIILRLRHPCGLSVFFFFFFFFFFSLCHCGSLVVTCGAASLLAVWYRSQRLWWLRTVTLAINGPHWRLLHLWSCVQSCAFIVEFFYSSCSAAEDLIFEFLFAASVTRLRFRTLLVAETLPVVGLFAFLIFSAAYGIHFYSGDLSSHGAISPRQNFFFCQPKSFFEQVVRLFRIDNFATHLRSSGNFGYGQFLDGWPPANN